MVAFICWWTCVYTRRHTYRILNAFGSEPTRVSEMESGWTIANHFWRRTYYICISTSSFHNVYTQPHMWHTWRALLLTMPSSKNVGNMRNGAGPSSAATTTAAEEEEDGIKRKIYEVRWTEKLLKGTVEQKAPPKAHYQNIEKSGYCVLFLFFSCTVST